MKQKLKMYGAAWCGDCHRSRFVFEKHNIDFDYVDIDKDEEAVKFVEKVNGGNRSIPTIVFADGSTLTEPSEAELLEKLGIKE